MIHNWFSGSLIRKHFRHKKPFRHTEGIDCLMLVAVKYAYSQWGLSFPPALSRSFAMGTLLVMMETSRGVRPSLLGVLRSSSSAVYWNSRICTASRSCCSTASNRASLLWMFCEEKKRVKVSCGTYDTLKWSFIRQFYAQ